MNTEEVEIGSAGSLFTIKQAAIELKASIRTVWRMIADGQLRVIRFRRCTRVLAEDVLRYSKNAAQIKCV